LLFIAIASGSVVKDSLSTWQNVEAYVNAIAHNWVSISFGSVGALLLILPWIPWGLVFARRKSALSGLSFSTDPVAVAKRKEAMNRAVAASENFKRLVDEENERPHLKRVRDALQSAANLNLGDMLEEHLKKKSEARIAPENQKGGDGAANLSQPSEKPSHPTVSTHLDEALLNAKLAIGGLHGAKALIDHAIEQIPNAPMRNNWSNWLDNTEAMFSGLVKTRLRNKYMEFLRAIKHENTIEAHFPAANQATIYLRAVRNNLKDDDLL
jgi:hypothetical protein